MNVVDGSDPLRASWSESRSSALSGPNRPGADSQYRELRLGWSAALATPLGPTVRECSSRAPVRAELGYGELVPGLEGDLDRQLASNLVGIDLDEVAHHLGAFV